MSCTLLATLNISQEFDYLLITIPNGSDSRIVGVIHHSVISELNPLFLTGPTLRHPFREGPLDATAVMKIVQRLSRTCVGIGYSRPSSNFGISVYDTNVIGDSVSMRSLIGN